MRRRFPVAALVMVVCLAVPGFAAAAPATPSADPFYSYSGSLTHVANGTVLRSRAVTVNGSGFPTPFHGIQVLYRTTNQLGQPDATVATIIEPTASVGGTKLLSYQTFYDGVASTCRPSYTLQDGSGSPGLEEGLMAPYLAQGYTVVTSDYEGPTDDFGAGRESGQGTLDAIRAAEHQLSLASSSPIGLIGYSGGSIASVWAAEVQPTYAPELHLVGVAAGGIPVDFAHNLKYIDGSSDWAGAIPAVSIGAARAYHLDFGSYLSDYGKTIASKVAQGCIDPSGYPGLTFESLLKPQYKDWETVPAFVRMFNDSILGRESAPREPLLMRVGNRGDGGDGVMIAKDVQQLAYEYCKRGVTVDFQVFNGDDHYSAAVPFEAQALTFLDARYAGTSATNTCAAITAGSDLSPLPTPASAAPAKPKIGLRERGLAVERRAHGVVIGISATGGTASPVTIQLTRNRIVVATARISRLTATRKRVVLSVRHQMPAAGRYVILGFVGHARKLRAGVTVHATRH
jgi:hypothetical protein